jgi:hypothetical protein
MEVLIYKGSMPFVRFSKAQAESDVASGEYRWAPPVAAPKPAEQKVQPEPVEVQWESAPSETAVNLNTASVAEMADLPDIGITIARRIETARPLYVIEDAIPLGKRVGWLELHKNGLVYCGEPEQ